MNNFITHLRKRIVVLIVVLASSFFLGFTVCNLINTYNGYYSVNFSYSTNDDVSFDGLKNVELIQSVKDSINKSGYYDEINVNTVASDIKITKNTDSTYTLITKSQYYPDFFLKSSNTVSTRAKTFTKTLIVDYGESLGYTTTFIDAEIIKANDPLSQLAIHLISAGSLLVFSSIYIFFEYKSYKKHINDIEIPYDNKTIFSTPFHKEYWKDVFSIFKSTKSLTILAMMLALMILCKFIALPSGFGNLGISFTYIIFAISSMIYGPFAGLILGILSDTIGYILFQTSYMWFIGYTFQAGLTGMIYGLVLYRSKISYSRCFIVRLLVSLFMNIILGSICWGIVAGYNLQQTFYYAVIFALPKNIVYLVPQSLLLFTIIKALAPALNRFGLISKEQYQYYIKKEVEKIQPLN